MLITMLLLHLDTFKYILDASQAHLDAFSPEKECKTCSNNPRMPKGCEECGMVPADASKVHWSAH